MDIIYEIALVIAIGTFVKYSENLLLQQLINNCKINVTKSWKELD